MKKVAEFGSKVANINDLANRKRATFPEIVDDRFWSLYEIASQFSMLHVPGFYNLYQSLSYIARNKLAGDIAECGCFLGGAGIFMALLRDQLELSKTIYLFDSFEGFPAGEQDAVFGKTVLSSRYADTEADVRDNIRAGAPNAKGIELIKGFVENTLLNFHASPLCLIRLDTDFYNSTKVELEVLYPRLVQGGVIIIDDYGMFRGSRTATDEYFSQCENPPLLNRLDRGIWAGTKP